MTKYILLLLLFSLDGHSITAEEARKLVNENFNRTYNHQKKWCVNIVEDAIKEAANEGEFYTQVFHLYQCWGNMLEEIEVDLNKRGFKTKIESVGMENVKINHVLTIKW